MVERSSTIIGIDRMEGGSLVRSLECVVWEQQNGSGLLRDWQGLASGVLVDTARSGMEWRLEPCVEWLRECSEKTWCLPSRVDKSVGQTVQAKKAVVVGLCLR